MNGKIFDEIKKCNDKSIFKIKYRKLNNGYSLYLEIRRKGIRHSVNMRNMMISGQVTKYSNDYAVLTNVNSTQKLYNQEFQKTGSIDFLLGVKKQDDDFFDYIEEIP